MTSDFRVLPGDRRRSQQLIVGGADHQRGLNDRWNEWKLS